MQSYKKIYLQKSQVSVVVFIYTKRKTAAKRDTNHRQQNIFDIQQTVKWSRIWPMRFHGGRGKAGLQIATETVANVNKTFRKIHHNTEEKICRYVSLRLSHVIHILVKVHASVYQKQQQKSTSRDDWFTVKQVLKE